MPTFLPRFPPPHIVCRPFLASSSLPAHHARRPQLRPLAPYAPNAGPQAVCRRTSVTQPAIGPAFRALGRSPHAEFTSALHLSAPLRGARLRSHHLPPRRSRVALLRSFFPPAASGSRTMNSASSVHRPSASIRVRSSVSPNHNTATSPPRCSLRKVCGSITPALWRRAFRSYVTPRDPPGLRSRSSHLARCAIPGCHTSCLPTAAGCPPAPMRCSLRSPRRSRWSLLLCGLRSLMESTCWVMQRPPRRRGLAAEPRGSALECRANYVGPPPAQRRIMAPLCVRSVASSLTRWAFPAHTRVPSSPPHPARALATCSGLPGTLRAGTERHSVPSAAAPGGGAHEGIARRH